MPSFVGVVWPTDHSKGREYCSAVFKSFLEKNKGTSFVEVGGSFWHVFATKRHYETNKENILVFQDKMGIVLGNLYSKRDDKDITQYPACAWKPENYWGEYIVIITNQERKEICIYKDPTGLAHVYFIQFLGILFFSSDIHFLADIAKMLKKPLQIDLDYFASYMAYGVLNTAKTPFKEVTELLPGCLLRSAKGSISTSVFWDPTNFVETSEDNVQHIIPVFTEVISKVMSNTKDICLQISGGLDSTSLFLMMNQFVKKEGKYILLNYLDKSIAASDESHYVKELVKNFYGELFFHELDYAFNLTKLDKWNRPHPGIMIINSRIALLEALDNPNFTFFSGQGGDQLFLSNVKSSFASDFILKKKFKKVKNLIEIFKNIHLINRTSMLPSVISIFRDLNKHLLGLDNTNPVLFKSDFAKWYTPAFRTLVKTEHYRPPFQEALLKVYPGKAQHILDIYHASALADFMHPGISEVCPYLMQPMVEMAVSIPTYCSFDQYWSRLHFRKAVADHFRSERVWRRSKGDGSGILQKSIRANLKRVEELCLDGFFAQKGYFHKDLLLRSIHLTANGYNEEQWPIIFLTSAELWIEAWSDYLKTPS